MGMSHGMEVRVIYNQFIVRVNDSMFLLPRVISVYLITF